MTRSSTTSCAIIIGEAFEKRRRRQLRAVQDSSARSALAPAQAACHPGLIDKRKIAEPSAKVDTLLDQLDQVLEENHKALVFSQFTSLLAIVRSRLDKAKIPYVYLDGRTRDRQAKVEEFQNNPTPSCF